jgi:hypothetical protein
MDLPEGPELPAFITDYAGLPRTFRRGLETMQESLTQDLEDSRELLERIERYRNAVRDHCLFLESQISNLVGLLVSDSAYQNKLGHTTSEPAAGSER